jgi:amino-acid N-acetyltransferase
MVVELEDTLVGYGSLDIADELAIIRCVYIAHNYRNQGLGDGLVRALINYADRRAVKRIYIFSDREIDYFKRFGFKYISSDQCDIKIVGAYNTNSDDYSYIMELDIDEYFNSRHCH